MNIRRVFRTACFGALSVALCFSAILALPAGASPPSAGRSIGCTDGFDGARRLVLRVDGSKATGHFALPKKRPTGLVVFAHGYGHTSFSWVGHMTRAARDHGVVAVAMDYRGIKISPDDDGDGLPESRGWNVMTGAEDSIAAARLFESSCSSIKTVSIMGVSMGGNTSGLAVALAGERGITKREGDPLFDYWYDIEGAINLIETYTAARLAAPADETAKNASEDIEAETGGPIEQYPEAYRDRTVAARIADIRAAGLDGVVIVHGLDDGLVPYNQAREMAALLGGAGISTDVFSIGRRSPKSEKETTLTGHVVGQADENYKSPLAGHASEKSTTHIVMVTAFDRLWALMDGNDAPGPYREFLVDGEAGTFPEP